MAEFEKMDDATQMDGLELSDAELEGVTGGLTEENMRFLVGMAKECKSHNMSTGDAQRYMRKHISPTADKLFVDESMAYFSRVYRSL